MPAIITDQIRVLNATNFVSGISTTDNSYYVFIGLPNATSVASDWNTATPSPIDNFDEHDNVYDSLISAKKITSYNLRLSDSSGSEKGRRMGNPAQGTKTGSAPLPGTALRPGRWGRKWLVCTSAWEHTVTCMDGRSTNGSRGGVHRRSFIHLTGRNVEGIDMPKFPTGHISY